MTIGPINAPVVVVGDAMTKWEYDHNKPLSDKAVFILHDFLEQAGFDIDRVLYVPCYSGPKMSGVKLDGPNLQADAAEHLLPLIKSHPRKVVVGLGNNAVCALGVSEKPEGINKFRGK